MPSEKLIRILRARSPFSAEQIEAMSDAQGWNGVYANATPTANAAKHRRQRVA